MSKELKGKRTVESLLWHTAEGITVKPVYTSDDSSVASTAADKEIPVRLVH